MSYCYDTYTDLYSMSYSTSSLGINLAQILWALSAEISYMFNMHFFVLVSNKLRTVLQYRNCTVLYCTQSTENKYPHSYNS